VKLLGTFWVIVIIKIELKLEYLTGGASPNICKPMKPYRLKPVLISYCCLFNTIYTASSSSCCIQAVFIMVTNGLSLSSYKCRTANYIHKKVHIRYSTFRPEASVQYVQIL
jgi:hypothetical protein